MSYKKSNWVPYDPALSFEQNVTQGGTTTADKLNNMETGISNAFDKTSDTIGGRNLLIGTHSAWQPFTSTEYAFERLYITDSDKINEIIGKTVSISAELLNCSGNCNVQIWYYDKNNGNARTNIAHVTYTYVENGKVTATYNVPSNISVSKFEVVLAGNAASGVTGSYRHEQLEQGSIATDWTPAPEDKVNVSDMRKPASDVAGIEEVNAKQDAIGYTPADDSKVVHSTDTTSWQKYPITDVTGSLTTYIGPNYQYTSIKQLLDTSINGFYTTYIAEGTPDTPDSSTALRGTIQLENNFVWGILTGELTKVSYYVGGSYNRNTSDTSDLHWVKLANDSAVAHLSGTNNFDTVPTVNNKSLATTDDVATASNTVLTSANTSISKLLQSSSNNDEDSAVTNSTSDTNNFYYWTE